MILITGGITVNVVQNSNVIKFKVFTRKIPREKPQEKKSEKQTLRCSDNPTKPILTFKCLQRKS